MSESTLDKLKGYIAPEDLAGKSDEEIVAGYQEKSGLVPDGVIGDVTAYHVDRPRMCRNVMRLGSTRAAWSNPEWDPNTGKWKNGKPVRRTLTYYVGGVFPNFSQTATDKVIAEAWDRWRKVAAYHFVQVKTAAEALIVIGFSKIDKRSGILGEFELPFGPDGQIGGRFDTSELWQDSLTPSAGHIGAPHVATHEFGHALGSDHGPEGALMAPFYDERIYEPQAWDIKEIQLRGGPPPADEEPTLPPTKPPTGAQKVAIDLTLGGIRWLGQVQAFSS